ncbi:MAG: 4Fe-4S binding protein [Rhodothermales bacterium]
MKKLSISDRLGLVAYRNQGRREARPHILVDTNVCNTVCPHKCTTYVCPAECYKFDDRGQVIFQFEDCIECGSCMYACDQGAVTWKYPDPEEGRGVTWNFG